MFQIKNLTVMLRKDLRAVIENFSLSLNNGDRAVIIGEEGNGKSTLLRAIAEPEAVARYADISGEIVTLGAKIGFLRQEMDQAEKLASIAAYCGNVSGFWDSSPAELAEIARSLGLDIGLFYSGQSVGSLSGGERVKLQLAGLLVEKPDIFLLDEPSNDIDLETLRWLEQFIVSRRMPVIFVSHDETLIERTANMIIHMEMMRRKTAPRTTVARSSYGEYAARRSEALARQTRLARKEKYEFDEKMGRFSRIRQQVESDQAKISRGDPHGGRLLKKKMHAVKSLEHRFAREHEDMTQMPDTEEAIFVKFDRNQPVPAGKTVLDLELDVLKTEDRILARDVRLRVMGGGKLCVTGKNGCGKTTLLRLIAERLLARGDIHAAYMPQNYAEALDYARTPVEFLAPSGRKQDITLARTYLGSMNYTPDEMNRAIGELSGGQQGKLLLLKMSIDGANVLILDEPTRNFSPLSAPVLRAVLKDFPGTIISVSHDRKYIAGVCSAVYELTENGLSPYGTVEF